MNLTEMQKILVIGAGGFLGKYLIDALLEKNEYEVLAFDLAKERLVAKFPNRNEIFFYDTSDWKQGNIPFNEVDIVIHCAFSRSMKGSELAKSLIFAQEIFSVSAANNCHVINISSRSVYGQNPNIPWCEMTPVDPDSLYALSKFDSELLLKTAFSSNKNTFYTNIRLAGLIGPELDARIVNKFIHQALNGETSNIKGGSQQFAFFDVKDAADGLVALLQTPPQSWKPIYNLGYIRSYSIMEIADMVAKTAREFNCDEVAINLEKTDDRLYAEIDSSLFYNDTGWQPKYDMQATIRDIFLYQLRNR